MGTCTLDLKTLWQQNVVSSAQSLEAAKSRMQVLYGNQPLWAINYTYTDSDSVIVDSKDSFVDLYYTLTGNPISGAPPIEFVLIENNSQLVLTYTSLLQQYFFHPNGEFRSDIGKYTVCFANRDDYEFSSEEPYYRTKSGLPYPIIAHAFIPAEPPKEIGIFTATDAVFGNVRSGVIHTKTIQVQNKSSVPIEIWDIQPPQNDLGNFEIGGFTYNAPGFNPTPYDTPIVLYPSSSREFSVSYKPITSPSNDGVELQYSVRTVKDKIPVIEEKLFSILEGSTYSLSVSCSDFDFGEVDIESKNVTGSITIQNNSTVDVVVHDYVLSKPSDTHFLIKTDVKGKTIPAGQFLNIAVEYVPDPFMVDIRQTQIVNFSIKYENEQVLTEKLFSTLTALPYEDWIDVIDDDFDDDEPDTYTDKRFSNVLDKTLRIMKKRTYPLWDCVGERLYQYFTGSNGSNRDAYFIPVFSEKPGSNDRKHQFDISYGHAHGSGSALTINGIGMTPSKVMYRKYLVETHGTTTGNGSVPNLFTFRNGVTSDSVYFIQVDRDHYKDMIDPGNFELCLVPLSSSVNQLVNTGSNFYVNPSSSIVYTLIDDSGDFKQDRTDRSGLKEYYHLVSGSRRDGEYGESTDNSWGLFYPKMGLFILDANVLDMSCSFNTVTASIDGDNIMKLFVSISGSGSPNEVRTVSQSFFARSAETAITQTYFARVDSQEFLYSNNPTFVKGNTNQLKYDAFIRNPITYITTIGLYTKRGELVAVGKLKKPIRKTNTDSYVFQVRVRIM